MKLLELLGSAGTAECMPENVGPKAALIIVIYSDLDQQAKATIPFKSMNDGALSMKAYLRKGDSLGFPTLSTLLPDLAGDGRPFPMYPSRRSSVLEQKSITQAAHQPLKGRVQS